MRCEHQTHGDPGSSSQCVQSSKFRIEKPIPHYIPQMHGTMSRVHSDTGRWTRDILLILNFSSHSPHTTQEAGCAVSCYYCTVVLCGTCVYYVHVARVNDYPFCTPKQDTITIANKILHSFLAGKVLLPPSSDKEARDKSISQAFIDYTTNHRNKH